MNFDRMKPLVLTGWTFWRDDRYIDLVTRNLNKQNKCMREAGHLRKIEVKNKILKGKQTEYDEAIEKYKEENAFGIFREEKMRELIIQELKTNNYHFTGDYHQEGDFGCPVFNDKYIYCTSCREWGEIMAEAYPDEDYDGLGLAQRYLKWAFIDEDLKDSDFVFPDPEKEIYKRRLESLKSKRRKNKDENSDAELIFGNKENEDYENSEFDEDDDYDYDEEEYEEDEEDED